MNNSRKIAMLLALQMFLTASGTHAKVSSNDKLQKNETRIEAIHIPQKMSARVNDVNKEQEIMDKTELEPYILTYRYAYITNDTEMLLDSGETVVLEKYQGLLVFNETPGLYYVDTVDYGSGVMLKENLEFMPDTFVEVDLSDQKVYLYIDNELYLSTKTVTGKPSTPTHEGYFEIYNKKRNTKLRGPGYVSYVNYWMPYDSARGLHDATWRKEEDFENSETYLTNGSHGCVNLPKDDAKNIYDNVKVGTRVLVHK